MTFPLSPDDLEVGKLYKGVWFNAVKEDMSDIWLFFNPEEVRAKGILSSMKCFVLIEKKEISLPDKGWDCKILTSNGDVGWATFLTGSHWFKELTENNT